MLYTRYALDINIVIHEHTKNIYISGKCLDSLVLRGAFHFFSSLVMHVSKTVNVSLSFLIYANFRLLIETTKYQAKESLIPATNKNKVQRYIQQIIVIEQTSLLPGFCPLHRTS